jgi:hypothetical protein
MAIKLINREWCVFAEDFRCEFIVDSDDDFASLPKSCAGSTAVSPSGKVMMVNASGEWVEFGG